MLASYENLKELEHLNKCSFRAVPTGINSLLSPDCHMAEGSIPRPTIIKPSVYSRNELADRRMHVP